MFQLAGTGKNVFTYATIILFSLLIMRKIILGYAAMNYVKSCKHQVDLDLMKNNPHLSTVIQTLSNETSTLVLMLNKFAVNMTLNWLCNTQHLRDVHKRSLIVHLDKTSYDILSKYWPNVKQLHWDVPCLQAPFNYGDGCYQLFYLFRSNFARLLIDYGKPFWMIQQDTFWRKRLFDINLGESNNNDILFDLSSEEIGSIIAGGYFMANPTNGSRTYFRELSSYLSQQYVPDNTVMTLLCADSQQYRCGFIPFYFISNWIWIHEPSKVSSSAVPYLVQFDGDTKLGGKLNTMRDLGFYFLMNDGFTCNASAVEVADNLLQSRQIQKNPKPSFIQLQMGFYTTLINLLNKFSITRTFLLKVVYPNAHYFMFTV